MFALLLLVAYLLPFHVHPFRSYYNDALPILGVLLLAFFLGLKKQWRFVSLSLVPLGMVAWIVLQTVLIPHQDFYDLLFPCTYIALAALAMVLGASLTESDQQRDQFTLTIASVFFIAGVVSVLAQFFQVLDFNVSPYVMYMVHSDSIGRPYANIAQPNQLALILSFALAATYFLHQQNLLERVASIIAIGLLLIGIVLTQSRIGWIIVPAFSVFLWRRSTNEQNIPRLFLLLVPALYFALVFLLPYIVGLFGQTGGSLVEHIGGRSERSVLWKQAWHMAASHPWLGVGWFGFGSEQVKIAADFSSSTYAEHAHNIVLNLAAEIGWPITICLSLGFVWWFWQTCIRHKQSLSTRFAALCLIAATVHSMVEFPLWYAYILLPVAVLMGILHQQRWPAVVTVVSPRLVIPVVLGSVLVMNLMTWDYQRVVAGFNVLRYQKEITEEGKKALVKPAYTFYPEFFDYFRLMQIQPYEGMSARDIAYVEKWTLRFGFVHILNKLAEIYVLNGEPKKAVRMMQTLQRLHPYDYPEYFDYWKAKGVIDPRYQAVVAHIPPRDAP
ncbi:Wzy polymerase domain-containing protein [Undibacterium sp. SXout11W]|uniref:PglL family O-oligosaccharyltransferase n=1 Tax=Undibacterium sp. SXout11W TaxID=3413050 RepID=UPI003BF30B7A